MGLITRSYSFADGAVPTDTQFNVDIDQLFTLVSGNLDAANVDTSSADGIVTMNGTQTLTGPKTLSGALVTAAGVRVGDTPTEPNTGTYGLSVAQTTLTAPASISESLRTELVRTAGDDSNLAHLYGVDIRTTFNQTSAVGGFLYGGRVLATLTDGAVGDGTPRAMVALEAEAEINGGSVTGVLRGLNVVIDNNAGTAASDAVAVYNTLENSSTGAITGDAKGFYLKSRLSNAPTGTAYGLQIEEDTGALDWAIHHTGTGTSTLGNSLALGGTAFGSGTNVLALTNGTAPSGSITNGVLVYSEDVSASAELKVRDEAGNVTTLS